MANNCSMITIKSSHNRASLAVYWLLDAVPDWACLIASLMAAIQASDSSLQPMSRIREGRGREERERGATRSHSRPSGEPRLSRSSVSPNDCTRLAASQNHRQRWQIRNNAHSKREDVREAQRENQNVLKRAVTTVLGSMISRGRESSARSKTNRSSSRCT